MGGHRISRLGKCLFRVSTLGRRRFICFERQSRPCREPHFSRGFCEGGGTLPKDWSVFSRALNAFTVTESLSSADLPARFIPELRDLIAATLDGRDLT